MTFTEIEKLNLQIAALLGIDCSKRKVQRFTLECSVAEEPVLTVYEFNSDNKIEHSVLRIQELKMS